MDGAVSRPARPASACTSNGGREIDRECEPVRQASWRGARTRSASRLCHATKQREHRIPIALFHRTAEPLLCRSPCRLRGREARLSGGCQPHTPLTPIFASRELDPFLSRQQPQVPRHGRFVEVESFGERRLRAFAGLPDHRQQCELRPFYMMSAQNFIIEPCHRARRAPDRRACARQLGDDRLTGCHGRPAVRPSKRATVSAA